MALIENVSMLISGAGVGGSWSEAFTCYYRPLTDANRLNRASYIFKAVVLDFS